MWGRVLVSVHLLCFPALQYLAYREEGEMPELAVHGLVGDAVPGPQTSGHPDPREPGKRAHLLLPVTTGWALSAQSRGCLGHPPVWGGKTRVLLYFKLLMI